MLKYLGLNNILDEVNYTNRDPSICASLDDNNIIVDTCENEEELIREENDGDD